MKNGMRKIHPGEILREDYSLTAAQLAERTGLPQEMALALLQEQASITPEIAAALARGLGGDAQSWINLQAAHDPE